MTLTHPFLYRRATSIADATKSLGTEGAVSLGGGTDLLVAISEEIVRPDLVVDLRALPGSDVIEETSDGSMRIGASVRIADIALHPSVREHFPALAQACAVVGTPALRHMGTIGGNLCQRPRCWYFRQNIPCLRNGGPTCPAKDGENQYLAILDGGPCYIVHPSDPAVALTALGASVEIVGPSGTRVAPIDDLYVLPAERLDRETILERDEFIAAILLPADARGGAQRYHKLMQREAWDFALVSIAGCKRANGDVCIVLGGVAPRPWRIGSSIEEDVSSGNLDDDTIETLAERALYDAEPLSKNEYKVALAASLLRRVIAEIA